MRTGFVAVCALFVLVAVPGVALGATPPRWPTAADVRGVTPELGAKDAVCIARYYRGRLSRDGWLTPYYRLTRAQKVVTDAGFSRCMSPGQRAALIAREDTLYFGTHPAELRCTSRRMAARRSALLLSITTLAQAIREDDKVYRECHLIGALYATLGRATQLVLTRGEQSCANRVGSAEPMRSRGRARTTAQSRAVGNVFDRCVGRTSEEAMWRRLLKDFRPAGAIPCVARHSVGITFATFFSDNAGLRREAKSAAAACVVSPGTR
jgi:hypothetical protein